MVLLTGANGLNHPVDGLGVVGAGEKQVARFGRRHGNVDDPDLRHLAHQDHVRILAPAAASLVEGQGIGTDLPLIDQAILVAVNELEAILDGNDVTGLRVVEEIDHGRQSGQLCRFHGHGHRAGPCSAA